MFTYLKTLHGERVKSASKYIALALVCSIAGGCAYTLQTFERIISPNSSAQVSEEIRKTSEAPVEPLVSGTQPDEVAGKLDKIAPEKPESEKAANVQVTENPKPKPTTKPAVSAAVPVKPAPKRKPAQVTTGSLSGAITILGKNQTPISAKGLILRLHQKDGESIREETAGKTHRVDMRQKTYLPGYISVNAGDTLTFVNSDTIKHNVFSSTGNNAFDLGTYDGGLERDVTLNESGLVKVYCNIHRNMAMFVSVDDQGRSEIADEEGNFHFSSLPAGDYELEIWHLRGKKSVQVSVAAGEDSQVQEVLNTEDFRHTPHKNKYGKNYQTKRSAYGYKREQRLLDDESF